MIHTGDCLEVMATLDAESIDAIVTDPPYGLEFMGMAWDQFDGRENGTPRPRNEWGDFGSREHARGQHDLHRVGLKKARSLQAFSEAWTEAALRVAKPGTYLLSFGGTRTVHRMACAIEDAGWIIRDMLVWAYASGFPKGRANLKPAWEPIVMARKPGPLRELAIDGCRIGTEPVVSLKGLQGAIGGFTRTGERPEPTTSLGRWPSNVILTDPIFDGGWDGVVGGGETRSPSEVRPLFRGATTGSGMGYGSTSRTDSVGSTFADQGTYSRFFLIPKAARSDREPVLDGLDKQWFHQSGATTEAGQNDGIGLNRPKLCANVHPTVKPVDLMRHLVRLVTPTGGTVLDPFLGSGTTALAAEMEGFAWIGIEKEAEYVAIAEARLNGTQKGMAL